RMAVLCCGPRLFQGSARSCDRARGRRGARRGHRHRAGPARGGGSSRRPRARRRRRRGDRPLAHRAAPPARREQDFRRRPMRAFAPGIYPRSEALVQATRDLERGRTSPEAVAEQEQRDFQELVSVQRAAGLSFLSDGMLAWQDLFRPLADAAEGLDARPLTRFLDTNTFYRAVLVGGEPHLVTPLPAPDLPAGEWVGTLPSPLAFARAARDEVSAQKLAANVLAPQIAAWAGAGAA